MAHPELELISNILSTGDFNTPKKKGLTPEWFTLDVARDAYHWLWNEYHDPQQRGEVPTVERFLRKFPGFDYSPSRNSLNALITDVRTQKVQSDLQSILNEMQDEITDGSDPSLILDTFLPKIRRMNVEAHEEDGILLSGSLALLRQQYNTHAESGGVVGIPYPWEVLNQKTGGMRDEEFIVIYGRPGNMKTWVACAIAAKAYLENHRVMIFSKEISREAMLTRVCSVLGNVDYDRLRRGILTEEDADEFFELMDELAESEEEDSTGSHHRALMFMSDKGKKAGSTVEDLIAAAERFQPDLIVVDGFYLMKDGRSGQRTADWKQISHISQDLKAMAQFVGCPVIGTTQANRANAKEPSGDLDDLSFADGIGQDADIAFRVFRGPNPSGRGASLLFIFSKSRETVIPPFIINANPGSDFSVQQSHANVKAFLDMKKQMEMSEGADDDDGSGGAPKQEAKKKPKKRDDPFRA
jgi:replicative DNA helicase